MLKSCSKCGKIHDFNYICKVNNRSKPKKTEQRTFRNRNKWHEKAEEIKKRACYLCEVCRQENIYTYDNLETHHITPLEEDIDKGLDNYNLIVLCSRHHKEAEAGLIKKEYLEELARIREDGTP